jgi:hypothetical protein
LRERQLVVKELVEDQDLVKERQELTRTKSPAELSQISSISEFPIPANVENLLKKKRYAFCLFLCAFIRMLLADKCFDVKNR